MLFNKVSLGDYRVKPHVYELKVYNIYFYKASAIKD